jgi:hypothetical protein
MSFEKAVFINSSYINIEFQAFDIAGLGVTALKHAMQAIRTLWTLSPEGGFAPNQVI